MSGVVHGDVYVKKPNPLPLTSLPPTHSNLQGGRCADQGPHPRRPPRRRGLPAHAARQALSVRHCGQPPQRVGNRCEARHLRREQQGLRSAASNPNKRGAGRDGQGLGGAACIVATRCLLTLPVADKLPCAQQRGLWPERESLLT